MGTRAVYTFNEARVMVHFYVHWDGYPQGAAGYFREMLNQDARGCALKFARAVPFAELTTGADAHGDLEYRYEINTNTSGAVFVRAYKRDLETDQWSTIFYQKLPEFIAQELGEVVCMTTQGYMPIHDAWAHLDERGRQLQRYVDNGQWGNASSVANGMWQELMVIRKSIKDIPIAAHWLEEIFPRQTFILKFTPTFVKAYGWEMEDAESRWNDTFYWKKEEL